MNMKKIPLVKLQNEKMEQTKFKLREEKIGAMLFDSEKGAVKELTEEKYQNILKKDKEFSYLFNENGKPLFRLFKSKIPREKLPSDCLSAPSKVYFEITRKCNLNCKNCYNKSNKALSEELSTDKILELIREVSENGSFELRVTGGEPTTHPDFLKIVRYAKDLGLFLSLGTNGVWNEELTEKIMKLRINIIIVSLDGPPEINDIIRGKGTFDKIISTIKKLRQDKNLLLKVNVTLGKFNKDYIEYIVKLVSDLGVDVVNIAPIKLTGRASEKKSDVLSPEEVYEVVKKVMELRRKYNIRIQTFFDIIDKYRCWLNDLSSLLNKKSCAAGIEVAVINPHGDVYGCTVSPAANLERSERKELFTAGNVKEDDFMNIWHNSSRWKVYRNFEVNKSEKCKNCRFYTISCFGNCIVGSYVHSGKLNAIDPYCFVDLIKNE